MISAVDPAPRRKPICRSLFFQLVVAIVIGVTIGAAFPDFGKNLEPISDAFIKLIKMMIAPIIFCVVVTGIAHVGDLEAAERIGVEALIYFEVVTTFAPRFGLLVGHLVQPGAGFDVDPATIAGGAEKVAQKTGDGELPHTVDFLLNIIPTSVVDAFATNALLQVLFFAVFFDDGARRRERQRGGVTLRPRRPRTRRRRVRLPRRQRAGAVERARLRTPALTRTVRWREPPE